MVLNEKTKLAKLLSYVPWGQSWEKYFKSLFVTYGNWTWEVGNTVEYGPYNWPITARLDYLKQLIINNWYNTQYCNYLTCSKRLLHWGNADWFSVYSFNPTLLTRTTTTFWILPAQVMSHHLGYPPPTKDANKIKSLMFVNASGEVERPCPTLNTCLARGTTFSCSKKYTWLYDVQF